MAPRLMRIGTPKMRSTRCFFLFPFSTGFLPGGHVHGQPPAPQGLHTLQARRRLCLPSILEDGEWRSLGLEPPHVDSFVHPRADEPTHFRPIPEDARETRFLCSINAPTQIRIQALIDMWDHGQHIAFREEIIKGRDLIPLPPSWWPSTSCPRRHGWWVQAVDSITLTRCKGCLGMVQITFLNPNTKTCHSCCSTADTSTAGSANPHQFFLPTPSLWC